MADKYKIAASIDVGSSAVRMKIAQAAGNSMEQVDNFEYPLNLGKESFNNNKIQFSTMQACCDIINKYYDQAHQLGISGNDITLTGTTALREAQNSGYICDQIMVKTGHKIAVLEDGEEKTYIFRHMMHRIEKKMNSPKCYMMAYIGTGGLGIAVCVNSRVFYSQNIRIGSLKLNETIGDMAEMGDANILDAVKEYIDATFDQIHEQIDKHKISQLFITGKSVSLLSHLFPGNKFEKKEIVKLYKTVSAIQPSQIAEKFSLSSEQADIFLPTLALYDKLLNISKTSSANIMEVSLCDVMLYKSLFPTKYKQMKVDFERSSVTNAQAVAQQYRYDKAHAESVEKFALTIFDNLKKIHGFSRKERLYLEVASILHDIGKFVNLKAHNRISADIIIDSAIIGFTEEEIAIIANIARYHSMDIPTDLHRKYNSLSSSNKTIVSKLSAILRLADALDRSHLQKIKTIRLELEGNRLNIIVCSKKDILLEQWTFKMKSMFFEEVFGIKCALVNTQNS
ncbi:MAG: HD domain-containing protein [Clostridia bacterium]|nr:HD domain-containing protein [Clostridia bacterium]